MASGSGRSSLTYPTDGGSLCGNCPTRGAPEAQGALPRVPCRFQDQFRATDRGDEKRTDAVIWQFRSGKHAPTGRSVVGRSNRQDNDRSELGCRSFPVAGPIIVAELSDDRIRRRSEAAWDDTAKTGSGDNQQYFELQFDHLTGLRRREGSSSNFGSCSDFSSDGCLDSGSRLCFRGWPWRVVVVRF